MRKIHFPYERRLLFFALGASVTFAGSYDPKPFAEMRWCSIGPFRGGRTRACAGVPGQPNVFYIGALNGGRLENHRLWSDMASDLRRSADRLDRHDRSSALGWDFGALRRGRPRQPAGE